MSTATMTTRRRWCQECPGIEIEPRVWSGCTAKETGAKDCPTCGAEGSLPRAITICAQNQGYHANGAGPCFESLGAALAHRDKEDAKATATFDRFARESPSMAQNYAEYGWPDRAWNTNRPPVSDGGLKRDHTMPGWTDPAHAPDASQED